MVGRNMAIGVTGSDLMVRPGPDNFEAALMLPHARPMDFTGRPMKGFVYVGVRGHRHRRCIGRMGGKRRIVRPLAAGEVSVPAWPFLNAILASLSVAATLAAIYL